MSEKLEELISLLYQDRLTKYGKRLLVENIEKLQKENEELEEINNKLEAVKDEAIRRYNFESIPVSLVEEKIEWLEVNILDNEYASDNDKDIAEYQVQALQELIKESEE